MRILSPTLPFSEDFLLSVLLFLLPSVIFSGSGAPVDFEALDGSHICEVLSQNREQLIFWEKIECLVSWCKISLKVLIWYQNQSRTPTFEI